MADNPIVTNHGVIYPSALGSHIELELTLCPPKQLIKTTGDNPTYRLTNIQLAYETIRDSELAGQVQGLYNSGKSFLYEHVHHFRTIPFRESDTIINENINIPRRSMKGILVLFTEDQEQDKFNSELFINPQIINVEVMIEGIANKIYAQKIQPMYLWKEAKRYFMKSCCKSEMDELKFLRNKFCLFIDLRTFENKEFHGHGLRMQNTKDGVQLAITRKYTANTQAPNIHDDKMYAQIFVLSDAMLTIEGSRLKSIIY